MTIEEQLNLMPIEEEIQYMILFIKRYCNLWNIKNLTLVNKNTIEDKAFLAIYKNNKHNLYKLNIVNNIKDVILNRGETIIINTDTKLLRETQTNFIKTNYTLNLFLDYTPEYLMEILKFYKVDFDNANPTPYGMEEELLPIFNKYINNELDVFDLDNESRKKLIEFLKIKNKRTNISFINSSSKILLNEE